MQFFFSGITFLLLVATPALVLSQPPGGGPPGGGGGPGGGAREPADAATPAGVNLRCDDPEVNQECLVCELDDSPVDPAMDTRRRRYEIRDMPADHWEAFVFGMQEMKALSLEAGKEKYGPLFKTHDYLVAQHAVASKSLRGDQGHFGTQFLSFHAVFCLALETSLLQIAEVSGRNFTGIPYYWMLDSDANEVLQPEYFGTHPGQGNLYEVTDGPFAYWPIAQGFDISDYSEYMTNVTDNGFEGNSHGFLRSAANNASNPYYVAYPSINRDIGIEVPYSGFDYLPVLECLETPYNSSTYNIYNFTYCIDNFSAADGPWHSSMHASIGGRAAETLSKYDPETMANAEGDLLDVDTSPNAPIFTSFHATIDMFLREWASRYPEGAATTWGTPYALSYSFMASEVVPGASGNDVISSAWPVTWADLGWADFGTEEGSQYVTHAQTYCYLAKENAPYVYVRYSGAPDTAPGIPVFSNDDDEGDEGETDDNIITGTIYCDNYFEFYFNGELIAKDPMTFIPHQAVEVSFEWDGVSDKEYAIMCQDFATESGYEYTESTRTGLGDGALVAAFSDGTRTSTEWKSYVVTYGPTEESESNGCSADNLDVCVVEDYGLPDGWFGTGFDFSGWSTVTEYTSDEAGWGRTPTWVEGVGCCLSISPLTGENLVTNNGCSVNFDIQTLEENAVEVDSSGCADPRSYFDTGGEYSDAAFVWGSSLTKDNQMLFRLTVPASAPTVPTTSLPTPAPIAPVDASAPTAPTTPLPTTPVPIAPADTSAPESPPTPLPTTPAAPIAPDDGSNSPRKTYQVALSVVVLCAAAGWY